MSASSFFFLSLLLPWQPLQLACVTSHLSSCTQPKTWPLLAQLLCLVEFWAHRISDFRSPSQHWWAGWPGLSAPSRPLWVHAAAEPALLSAGLERSLVAAAGAGQYPNSRPFFPLLMAKICTVSTSLGCSLYLLLTRLGLLVFHGNFWSPRNPFLSQRPGSCSWPSGSQIQWVPFILVCLFAFKRLFAL